MDVSKYSGKVLKEYEKPVHPNVLSAVLKDFGSLQKNSTCGYFFKRKNERYQEVISGYGRNYSFGFESFIVDDLVNNNVDLIIIETQYAIYEISLDWFLNTITESGVKGVWVCREENFVETKKNYEEPKSRSWKRKNPKPIKKQNNNGKQGNLF